jgi:hypothetical protein
VNTGNNSITQKFKTWGALLMVALMLSVFFVQVFHKHPHTSSSGNNDHTSKVFSGEKCKICDHFLHKNGKNFIIHHPPVMATIFPQLLICENIVYERIYKCTLQCFCNKGPPFIYFAAD